MADLEDHEKRLLSLEIWQATTIVEQPYMEKRFDAIDRKLEQWNVNVSKVFWLIASSCILAGLAFIFKGGLAP